VASDRAASDQAGSLAELTAANEKLTGDNRRLQAETTTLRAESARLAQTGETAAALRKENDDLKAKLAETDKAVDKQGSSVAELTQLNEKLAAERTAQQQQIEALTTQLNTAQRDLNAARADATRLAGVDQARQDAEQRATALANASTQLTAASAQLGAAQRDLAAARAETARLSDQLQATERDRSTRLAQAQQENAALAARLRQAQTTLDQIASAARLINGAAPMPGAQTVPARPITNATPVIPVLAAPETVPPVPRYHVVAEGESLTRISMRYYGTSTRWEAIYDANRDVLKGENALRPGQRLLIP
jgi:nucleoid-associated protein YgaU